MAKGKGKGKGKKFQRGVSSAQKGKIARLQNDAAIDVDKAEESVKDLIDMPMEVEEVRFLQRQLVKTGIGADVIDERLAADRDERDTYNRDVLDGKNTNELYSKIRIPKGGLLIKLLKKPIFEVNGFLKPDLIKMPKESGQGFNYIENKFPYLDTGVIIAASEGAGLRFDLDESNTVGALVACKLGTRIDQKVAFIDRSEINPTYFEGHILIGVSDLEMIMATKTDPWREEMYEKATGVTAAKALAVKLEAEAKEREAKKQKTDVEKIAAAEKALEALGMQQSDDGIITEAPLMEVIDATPPDEDGNLVLTVGTVSSDDNGLTGYDAQMNTIDNILNEGYAAPEDVQLPLRDKDDLTFDETNNQNEQA